MLSIIAYNKHLLNTYYVPCTVLKDLGELTCFILTISCSESTTCISILWMRKLRSREVKYNTLCKVPQLVSGRVS